MVRLFRRFDGPNAARGAAPRQADKSDCAQGATPDDRYGRFSIALAESRHMTAYAAGSRSVCPAVPQTWSSSRVVEPPRVGRTLAMPEQAGVCAARISSSVSIGLLGHSDVVIGPPLKVDWCRRRLRLVPPAVLTEAPKPVTLSGVEEVDAELASTANRGDPLILVEPSPLTPQLPRAERNRRDLQASHAKRDGVQDNWSSACSLLAESLRLIVGPTVSAAPPDRPGRVDHTPSLATDARSRLGRQTGTQRRGARRSPTQEASPVGRRRRVVRLAVFAGVALTRRGKVARNSVVPMPWPALEEACVRRLGNCMAKVYGLPAEVGSIRRVLVSWIKAHPPG